MNKKIIVFICILSLLVPLLPSFDLSVFASDSVSDDSSGDGGGHSRNNHYTGALGRINQYLIDNGFVINDDTVITFNVLDTILEDNFSVDLDDYVSIYDKTNRSDLPEIYNNFVDSNTDFDFYRLDSILQSYFLDYAENNISYYSRSVIHVSDFLQVLGVIGTHNYNINRLNILQDKIKPLINGASSNVYVYIENSNRMGVQSSLLGISRDVFSDLSFYVKDINSASSDFMINGNGLVLNAPVPSTMWVISGNSVLSSLDVMFSEYKNRYYPSSDSYYSSPVSLSFDSNYQGFFNGASSGVNNGFNYFYGSLFIVADSIDIFSFPIFKDYTVANTFFSGDAQVYSFDKSIDLGQFGEDIDYNKLYDIISTTVRGNTGNVIDSINNVANNYLQHQLDLLHDINNALNDGNGQSWLRRIYGILDLNFPLTLNAFDDLIDSIQNISITGGSSDLSHINRVLDEINDKLGFMIEQPLTDSDIQDMEDLKNLAQHKFPFCVFSDVVAISVILNRPPVQPHWQIPLKLPGSSSVNNIEVDLSWYEEVRDLVQGVFIFIFIVGLLALSVKIFSALKS